MATIKCLFLDIGGVLMTNGWDRYQRKAAAEKFGLDLEDFQERHKKFYDLHEQGKLSLDDYLKDVVFYQDRAFTLDDFKAFMYSLSTPNVQMIELVKKIKSEEGIRMVAVSNEGRELIEYRIKVADLRSFIDDFFVSCFVGYQKPDKRIFDIAFDVTQYSKDEVLYIDDRANLIDAAKEYGINGLVNSTFEETKEKLNSLIHAEV